jgi:hypothetical protein
MMRHEKTVILVLSVDFIILLAIGSANLMTRMSQTETTMKYPGRNF